MSCTPAPTCKAALAEATRRWPHRSVLSDGICSSPQHRLQNPDSDHDTGDAFDLTHDPANGCDAHLEARRAVARRDRRIKYVISNRTIWRSYPRQATSSGRPYLAAWDPEPYTGVNPHTRHAHFSIGVGWRLDLQAWFPQPAPPAPPAPIPEPINMDNVIIVQDDSDRWWWIHLAAAGGTMVGLNGAAAANWVTAGATRVLRVDTDFANALAAKFA